MLQAEFSKEGRPGRCMVNGMPSGWVSAQMEVTLPKIHGGFWSFAPENSYLPRSYGHLFPKHAAVLIDDILEIAQIKL